MSSSTESPIVRPGCVFGSPGGAVYQSNARWLNLRLIPSRHLWSWEGDMGSWWQDSIWKVFLLWRAETNKKIFQVQSLLLSFFKVKTWSFFLLLSKSMKPKKINFISFNVFCYQSESKLKPGMESWSKALLVSNLWFSPTISVKGDGLKISSMSWYKKSWLEQATAMPISTLPTLVARGTPQ